MTDCKQIQEMFPAFLEEVISPEGKRLIHEHVATCQRCSAALEDLQKTQQLVQNLEEVETPPWFTQKIMARVREEAEQKRRGIFGRLFYPLHVKIPIQALASVLIVVLALYVYRSIEPEVNVGQAPSEVTRRDLAVPKNEAQRQYDKVGAGTSAPESKSVPEERREKAAGTIAAVPHTEAAKRPAGEEAPPLASLAAEPPKAEKKEAIADKQAQETRAAAPSPTQQAAPQAQKVSPPMLTERGAESSVSAGAVAKMKEARDRSISQSAGQIQAFAAKKAELTAFILRVSDVTAAAGEIKSLLSQLGAHDTVAESRTGADVITSELPVQKVDELFKKLSALGQVEEKGPRPVIREGEVSIRIEVTGKP